jgi:hypothetical protein
MHDWAPWARDDYFFPCENVLEGQIAGVALFISHSTG